MNNKLVLVKHTNGEKTNFSLNIKDSLESTRAYLETQNFMSDSDDFLHQETEVSRGDEPKIALELIVGSEAEKPLNIGSEYNGLPTTDDAMDAYTRLNTNEKLALFENIQIFRGLTASTDKGFDKTFKPCITNWNEEQLPAFVKPSFVTEININSSFSEVGQSMAVSSINSASASVSTPYGGGESSFEYAKKNTSSSSEVKQYLTASFYINKIDLDVDVENLNLVQDFEDAILKAVQVGNEIDQYYNLIQTLNERGYYIAKQFTIGGVLLTTSSTEIYKYSESEYEKKEFSVGFKLAIDGFGGGGDYSNTQESESSTSTETKYTNLSLTQKGGSPTLENYDKWIASLNPAVNWDVVKYTELYPTLALLTDKRLIHHCLKLLNRYVTYDSVKDLQKIIDIEEYTIQIEALVMTDTGIG